MKVYIGNVDWADEGDIFFFSVESEENLEAMKSLINILNMAKPMMPMLGQM